MNNSTAPPLAGDLLLIAQLDLVSSTTVSGTLYGIAFTLFCLYVHALAPRVRRGDRARQAKFMLAYSTVIMLCGLYFLVFDAWATQYAYIKHSDYPGGPLQSLETFVHTPTMIIDLVCETVIDILTSAIQVWRVWVIWSATGYANVITILPALCFLTFTGLELRSVVLDTTEPIAEAAAQDIITNQVEIAVQGATTVLCTVVISVYLIFKQWEQRKLIGKSQGSTGYMNIVAIIIESYVLESIWLLAVVILWNEDAGIFFDDSVTYIQLIAYLLVQYRVARGQSHESQRERPNISSLRWNRSTRITTQWGETGEIEGSPHVSAVPEASNDARVAGMV